MELNFNEYLSAITMRIIINSPLEHHISGTITKIEKHGIFMKKYGRSSTFIPQVVYGIKRSSSPTALTIKQDLDETDGRMLNSIYTRLSYSENSAFIMSIN